MKQPKLHPQKYATIKEAKEGLLKILAEHPEMMPKSPVPCKYCGEETKMEATKLCDGCWELDHRIRANPELAEKILTEIKNEQ